MIFEGVQKLQEFRSSEFLKAEGRREESRGRRL